MSLSDAERRRIAEWVAEIDMVKHSYGLHAGHSRRFEHPHWTVCSCGIRVVTAPPQKAKA